MSTGWLPLALVAPLLTAAGYHSWSLLRGMRIRRPRLDRDLADLAMCAAMITMLARPIGGPVGGWLAAGFALGAVWFAVDIVRRYIWDGPGDLGRDVGAAIGCTAMMYMLLPVAGLTAVSADGLGTAPDAMPGMAMSPTHSWALTVLLLAGLSAVAVWRLRSVWATRRSSGQGASTCRIVGLVPSSCEVVMSTATALMLLSQH